MGLLRIFLNIECCAVGVDRRFERNQVPRLQLLSWAVEFQLLKARQPAEHVKHTMASVISITNRNATGVQQDQCGVQRGQSRRVTDSMAMEQRRKNEFEAGVVGGRKTGVNVCSIVFIILHK